MTKKQKPLRELKRDTRRVVNDALVSLRDLKGDGGEDTRVPYPLHRAICYAAGNLEIAKKQGVNWWKNS